MYLLNLFRNWFSENVAEFDREGLSREVIAQKAFIAGFNAAQQSVQSDGATPCDNCGTIGAHDCSEPDNHPAIPPRR